MAYLPLARSSDNRRAKQAAVPITLQNVMFEPTPTGAAKRSEYFLKSRPGRIARTTLSEVCRGLFCEPGCQGGDLFAPAGSSLNQITSTWGYSPVGALSGGDVVLMEPFRANLMTCAFGQLKYYDGSTLTLVSDVDAPTFAKGMCVVALRVVAFNEDGDAFDWAKAGLPLDWDASGSAADIYLPDPIVAQKEIGGDLWSFNSRSIQVWQATAGAEDEAFSLVQGVSIRTGLFGRDLLARVDDGFILVGHDRAVYATSGFGVEPIANRDLELTLRAIAEDDLRDGNAWSYQDGSRRFWGLSVGLERAFVLDVQLGVWSDWTAYGESVFDIDFAATAFDTAVVAGKNSETVWELSASAHDDAGAVIERIATLHIPTGDQPIDRLVFDLETYDVPLSGQGSEPVMLVSVSTDNGQTWSEEEDVALPTASDRFRPQMWALGLSDAQAGMLVRMRWTDPLGVSFYGCWVNPDPSEIAL